MSRFRKLKILRDGVLEVEGELLIIYFEVQNQTTNNFEQSITLEGKAITV